MPAPQDNTPGINASTYSHWGVPRAPATKEPNSPEATAALCDAGLAYQKMWGWADADSETPAAAMCEIGRKQQKHHLYLLIKLYFLQHESIACSCKGCRLASM